LKKSLYYDARSEKHQLTLSIYETKGKLYINFTTSRRKLAWRWKFYPQRFGWYALQ